MTTAVPVLHNTCGVHVTPGRPGHGSCPKHSVPVYLDGLLWLTDDTLEPGGA